MTSEKDQNSRSIRDRLSFNFAFIFILPIALFLFVFSFSIENYNKANEEVFADTALYKKLYTQFYKKESDTMVSRFIKGYKYDFDSASVKNLTDNYIFKENKAFFYSPIPVFLYLSFLIAAYWWYYSQYKKFSIICKHCLKSITIGKFLPFNCPYCEETCTKRTNLFLGCSHCNSKIKSIQCVYCSKSIDLFEKYDSVKLTGKRDGKKG